MSNKRIRVEGTSYRDITIVDADTGDPLDLPIKALHLSIESEESITVSITLHVDELRLDASMRMLGDAAPPKSGM